MQTFSAKMPHWDKIVSSQVGAASWTNLKGKEHKKEHDKSMESFQDCITFHLLDMFPGDAAKQQRYYINNVLKKPQWVPVSNFSTSRTAPWLPFVPTLHLQQPLGNRILVVSASHEC